MGSVAVKVSTSIAGLLLLPGTAGAAELPRLLPSDARVAGLTYKQWDVKWTRKAAVTPTRSRKALFAERGGRRCGVQVGKVRMLPASIRPGRRLTVRCVVRSGTFLVFPVTGVLAGGETRRSVADVAEPFEAITRAELRINGQATDGPGHIITTPTHRVMLPEPNGLDVPPGPEWLRTRDRFAILSPLAAGRHVVKTLAIVDPPGERESFSIGMRYRITAR